MGAQRMSHHTGLDDLDDHVYDVLGYDHKEKKIGMGTLAENTHPQIKQQIEQMLQSERGFDRSEAKAVVDETWRDTPYIDMIVCGDDKEGKPKPNPHNALYICDKLGVRPSDTIMVGDTPADTLMGQQAKLGLTVGVLT